MSKPERVESERVESECEGSCGKTDDSCVPTTDRAAAASVRFLNAGPKRARAERSETRWLTHFEIVTADFETQMCGTEMCGIKMCGIEMCGIEMCGIEMWIRVKNRILVSEMGRH